MKAIHFVGKGQPKLTDITIDSIPPGGHALVRVRASGLCHTDIDVLHGRYGTGAFPVIPGHEYAGEIAALARDITDYHIGDRVAVDPNLPCGTCPSCRRGLTNLCQDLKAYGVTHDGGFADYSFVRVEQLHRIGDLSFDRAALAEPLACALNGLSAAGIEKGARVPECALVFGAGPIGLLLGLSLQAKGVGNVSVADINASRLAFASDLGMGAVHARSDQLASFRREVDFVADATGVPSWSKI